MRKRRFLWLTDIHYESPENRHGGVADSYDEEVFQPVERFLDSLADRKQKYDFIGVGGDLTTEGDPAGITKFEENLLPKLRKLLDKGNTSGICVVPGNHDVTWGIDPSQADYFGKKFAAFLQLTRKKSNGISTCLFPQWSGTKREVAFDESSQAPVYINKKAKLLVLNINSAVRCGELRKDLLDELQNDWGFAIPYPVSKPISKGQKILYSDLIQDVAHVTEQQKAALHKALNAAQQELRSEWSDYLRVALIHHHLGPYMGQHVDDRRYQHMVDSHKVLELLQVYDFHIALSGHTHQAYQYKYLFPTNKEIALIGGLTIGGFSAGPHGQGIRQVTVESNRYQHVVTIKNIVVDSCGVGDAVDTLNSAQSTELIIDLPVEGIVSRESKMAGHRCKEVISCTGMTRDGDAIRSVDYQEYSVVAPKGRRFLTSRVVDLPSTSGDLDRHIRAHLVGDSKGRRLRSVERIEQRKLQLIFEPALEFGAPCSYHVRWAALNAFALDKLQFSRKYAGSLQHENEEFAYYTPELPITRLTIVLQFPLNFRFQHEPRISVACVDVSRSNMRQWEEDSEATNALMSLGSLRKFGAFNAFSLMVKAPRTDRSYRIVWGLKDAEVLDGAADSDVIIELFNQQIDDKGRLGDGMRGLLSDTLAEVVRFLRSSRLLGGTDSMPFSHQMDASVMVWNLSSCPGKLKLICAIDLPGSGKEGLGEREKVKILSYNLELPYGVGIAGRTVKMNRIEKWDRKQVEAIKDEEFAPNYYVDVKGGPKYASLISIPLHIPVTSEDVSSDANAYRKVTPFGVITVGSITESLPGSDPALFGLYGDITLNTEVQKLQHGVNNLFYTGLKTLV